MPKSNREFWEEKFRRNVERDARRERQFAEMGWRLIVVWECELDPRIRIATLSWLCDAIRSGVPDEKPGMVAEKPDPYDS